MLLPCKIEFSEKWLNPVSCVLCGSYRSLSLMVIKIQGLLPVPPLKDSASQPVCTLWWNWKVLARTLTAKKSHFCFTSSLLWCFPSLPLICLTFFLLSWIFCTDYIEVTIEICGNYHKFIRFRYIKYFFKHIKRKVTVNVYMLLVWSSNY